MLQSTHIRHAYKAYIYGRHTYKAYIQGIHTVYRDGICRISDSVREYALTAACAHA